MRLSTVLLAVLSAFAAAQSSESTSLTTVAGASTTTVTAHLIKTVFLSRVHMTESTINSIQPTDGITLPTTTVSSTSATLPSLTQDHADVGAALDVGKVAFAGVVGIVVAVGIAGIIVAALSYE